MFLPGTEYAVSGRPSSNTPVVADRWGHRSLSFPSLFINKVSVITWQCLLQCYNDPIKHTGACYEFQGCHSQEKHCRSPTVYTECSTLLVYKCALCALSWKGWLFSCSGVVWFTMPTRTGSSLSTLSPSGPWTGVTGHLLELLHSTYYVDVVLAMRTLPLDHIFTTLLLNTLTLIFTHSKI